MNRYRPGQELEQGSHRPPVQLKPGVEVLAILLVASVYMVAWLVGPADFPQSGG